MYLEKIHILVLKFVPERYCDVTLGVDHLDDCGGEGSCVDVSTTAVTAPPQNNVSTFGSTEILIGPVSSTSSPSTIISLGFSGDENVSNLS